MLCGLILFLNTEEKTEIEEKVQNSVIYPMPGSALDRSSKGYVHYWANNDFLYHPINIELHLHTSYTHILHFQDARNTRLCLPCSHFKQKVKMTQNKNSKIYS